MGLSVSTSLLEAEAGSSAVSVCGAGEVGSCSDSSCCSSADCCSNEMDTSSSGSLNGSSSASSNSSGVEASDSGDLVAAVTVALLESDGRPEERPNEGRGARLDALASSDSAAKRQQR